MRQSGHGQSCTRLPAVAELPGEPLVTDWSVHQLQQSKTGKAKVRLHFINSKDPWKEGREEATSLFNINFTYGNSWRSHFCALSSHMDSLLPSRTARAPNISLNTLGQLQHESRAPPHLFSCSYENFLRQQNPKYPLGFLINPPSTAAATGTQPPPQHALWRWNPCGQAWSQEGAQPRETERESSCPGWPFLPAPGARVFQQGLSLFFEVQ